MRVAREGPSVKRILIAPEPAAWVSSLLTADTLLIAPWVLPHSPVFQLLPSAAQQFWLRRKAPAQDVRALLGWAFVDAAIRRLGSRVSLAWRLRQRALIDEWVSHFMPRDCEEVVAPTLCALKTFARSGIGEAAGGDAARSSRRRHPCAQPPSSPAEARAAQPVEGRRGCSSGVGRVRAGRGRSREGSRRPCRLFGPSRGLERSRCGFSNHRAR